MITDYILGAIISVEVEGLVLGSGLTSGDSPDKTGVCIRTRNSSESYFGQSDSDGCTRGARDGGLSGARGSKFAAR